MSDISKSQPRVVYAWEGQIEKMQAEIGRLKAALRLTIGMLLDLERGIAPSRADFEKARAALEGKP